MQITSANLKHISDKIIRDVVLNQIKFENRIKTIKRKDTGTFFTNSHKIIDIIIDIVNIDKSIYEKKILEPACGHGIYLMILIAKIYEKQPNYELLKRFIKNNIIFCDIQAEMVEFTKKNLSVLYKALTGFDFDETFNSFIIDFTEKEISDSLFDNNKTPLSKYYNQIDYIIGNPPYITYYGRRDRKQSEQQRVNYLNNYNQFPDFVQNGKINSVMLFIEHSLDFLKTDGKLSFIIDIAFFETAYFYTRKYLLENTKINSLILNINDFDVASGQLIIKLTKNKQNNDNQVEIVDFEKNTKFSVYQKDWNNSADEYKFRTNGCVISKLILDKINLKKEPSILQLYPNKNLRTCVMLLDMEDKFTFVSKNGFEENLVFPYYQGSKSLSQKYGKLTFTKYFYYNKPLQDEINDKLKVELEAKGIKNKKRLGLGETVIYDNPKIFIRQSAKEIIASLDLSKSSANNSLYSFTLRDNSEKSLKTLKLICGILNSKLITYYAQQMNIIRFSAGKQPQIKIADLGQIPILQDIKIQELIISLVEKIYFSNNLECANEIDKIIFEHYNISTDDILHIEKAIKDF